MANQRNVLRDVIMVTCLAFWVLILARVLINADVIHISALGGMTLNDQAGYLSVARNFAEKGVLESDIIYPSKLNEGASRNYLNMPGYYVLLGLSMKVFGDGALLLPGYLAFVVAVVCLYLIASRLYHRKVGLIAAALFCVFPTHVVYANTIMAELPFLAAALLAFCLFIHTPERYKLYVPPLLLVIPFVFRETGAFLVIPMALMLVDWKNRRHFLKVGGMILVSVMVLMLVYSMEFSSGRPSLLAANLFSGSSSAIYRDAFWTPPENLSWLDYWRAMMMKVAGNTSQLVGAIQRFNFKSFEMLTLAMVCLMALLLMMHARFLNKWDAFLVGVLSMLAGMLVLIFTIYTMMSFRGLRALMFVVPFMIVGVAAVLYQLRLQKYVQEGLCLVMLSYWTLSLGLVGINMSRTADLDKELIRLFEMIGHDDQKMLVARWDAALPYVVNHKTKWSFLPANGRTLNLLNKRYPIGTFVVPEHFHSPALASRLGKIGLRFKGTLTIPVNLVISRAGEEWLVYQDN